MKTNIQDAWSHFEVVKRDGEVRLVCLCGNGDVECVHKRYYTACGTSMFGELRVDEGRYLLLGSQQVADSKGTQNHARMWSYSPGKAWGWVTTRPFIGFRLGGEQTHPVCMVESLSGMRGQTTEEENGGAQRIQDGVRLVCI